MKKFSLIILASLMCFISCYDDTELRESITDHENRLNKLELLCSQINTNITGIEKIVQALEQKDYVTGVTPVKMNGQEIGYNITFSKSGTITIYHGKKGTNGQDGQDGQDGHAPQVGVKLDTDGIYYWTLDGEWIIVDGHKLRVEGRDGQDGRPGQDGQDGQNGQDGKPGENGQDGQPGQDGKPGQDGQPGITPQLRIIDGYWEISYDNGKEWTQLGKATGNDGQPGADGQDGDSLFQTVTVGETTVTFVLKSGETIILPKEKSQELTISFDDFDIGILPGGTARVGYTVHGGTEHNLVRTLVQGGWKATVKKSTKERGEIIVTAPDPLTEDEIAVLVSDGNGPTVMASINFVTGVITPSSDALDIPVKGGTYNVTVESNIEYEIVIPDSDKSWITIVSPTKSIKKDNLEFHIGENKGTLRKSEILIRDLESKLVMRIKISQGGYAIRDCLSFTANGVVFNMIKVEGGTFSMGATPEQGSDIDNDEKPVHQVTLSEYYIGQTEVTQELWEAVTGSNPSYHKGNSKYPVESVSWDDIANAFLPKLNELIGKTFTLPTEAQWEFAARGGNKSKKFKYSGSNNVNDVAWHYDNSNKQTHIVCQKLPNELELYDMSGNVWEWCYDSIGSYSAEEQTDPMGSAPADYRVMRGGSYYDNRINSRVSDRDFYLHDSKYSHRGFRLVLNTQSTGPQIPVEKIILNKSDVTLGVGETEILTPTIIPSNAPYKDVFWTSLDPSIATIENGKITALAVGQTEVLVRTVDGNKTAVCNVTVQLNHTNIVETVSANGISFNIVKVKGGTFTMGATPEQEEDAGNMEKPAHQVTLSDYYISQTEVTQELWEAVMGSNPSYNKGNSKCPVERVSWNDVVNEFLPKLNALTGKIFTLPTEAQWEFAARGGNKTQKFKYSGSNNLDEVAWNKNNSGNATHPVGQKLPNELGIYDMSGNVFEWCSDWYGYYSAEAQTNPTGPTSSLDEEVRVARGGGNNLEPSDCRVSGRSGFTLYAWPECGFRLALSL